MRASSRLAAVAAAAGIAVAATAAAASTSPAPPPRTALATTTAAAPDGPDGRPHKVTWDGHSLMLDGKRLYIWSGEFHYWRLPSPDLWRDVLEKMKAAGFNAASIYFDWGFHSPAPHVYDFTGIRDIDRLLRIAEQVGIWVIARPGPYINAETDSGGFPGWLVTQKGRARTSAADYTAAYREWLDHVDPILARHQVTRGGSVIVYQAENEYSLGPLDPTYMQALVAKIRSDGIDVPLDHNDAATIGNWAQGPGAVDMYAFDTYPVLFDCSNPSSWNTPPFILEPENFETNSRKSDPTDPPFLGEYQGGSFDPWGGPGYRACAKLTGPPFVKVFFKTALAQGVTLLNSYMAYGGTSWGWLAFPGVYTSYDYSAALDEARQLTPKYDEMKRIGYFTHAVPPLWTAEPAPLPASNPKLAYRMRVDPATGTRFLFVRHVDAQSTDDDTTTVSVAGTDGVYPVVPQQPGTTIRVNGRDMKTLVAGFDMDRQRLVYSTSELMTHATVGGRDLAVLYGRPGEDGETVLRYASRPRVTVLSGRVAQTWDASRGDLRLNYEHSGLARVAVTGGGRAPLLLLLGTDAEAAKLWRQDTGSGPLLERGPHLVRSARVDGRTLALRGDTDRAEPLEVFAPPSVTAVTWNGAPVRVTRTPSGSLAGSLPGPRAVSLPRLVDWRFRAESPETTTSYDDSSWVKADHTTTNNPTAPKTTPVLYMDDYGFHYGMVWYRGHFTGTGGETGITLDGEGGDHGTYSVWLNGRFLGTTSGAHDFAFPAGSVRKGRDNVVAMLLENMGHDEDFTSTDGHKAPRGFVQAALDGSSGPIAWRIQGARGGESLPDRTRGQFNNGGLFGERNGWHLPGLDTSSWRPVTLPDRWTSRGASGAGVGWYRASFDLSLPATQDVPLGLRISDDPRRHYQALVFINGWQVGRYWNDVGPQHLFSLPTGLLRPDGHNELAVAVWGQDATGGGLGRVDLVAYGNHLGGVPVHDVSAPGAR